MLAPEWEKAAAEFVNASAENALATLDGIAPAKLLNGASWVVLARDTRRTSFDFAAAVKQGILDAGGSVMDLGVATTPQLHFVVRARSRREPSEIDDYWRGMKRAFENLTAGCVPLRERLVVDCASGVGGAAVKKAAEFLPGIVVVNAKEAPGTLNEDCGADFVQKAKEPPKVYDASEPKWEKIEPECGAPDEERVVWKPVELASGAPEGAICASLDGDADRLVFYSACRKEGEVALADGDRFATLVAKRIADCVKKAGMDGVRIGVAQTAYSNGAATEFLEAIPGVEVKVSLTGVKHLEKTVEGFDVGIYWEPNGHGTVLYSDKFREQLEEDTDECASTRFLSEIGKLANQAVGDGVADLLMVVAILMRERMAFRDWVAEYEERFVANCVVDVRDKGVVRTEDMDRRVEEPKELGVRIEAIVGSGGTRAFVRPSGTEDVVRVFAEGGSQEVADGAMVEVARAVFDTCDGVGERP